jgi:hypothetical protein
MQHCGGHSRSAEMELLGVHPLLFVQEQLPMIMAWKYDMYNTGRP